MAIDYRAIIFVILAIILFGFSDFAAKLFAGNLSGSFREIFSNKQAIMSFLLMAGLGFGGFLSWVAALKYGDLSRLAPIQKMSMVVTVVLAVAILHEAWSWKTITATGMAIGAILLLLF